MRKKLLKYFSLICILTTCITLTIGCSKRNNNTTEPISKSEILMGTVVKVTIFDSNDETILDAAFSKVKDLESILSINTTGTLIDKINDSAGIEPVKVDDDTYNIIKSGLEYSKLSNGLFDITIGPLVKLWSIGLPEAKVPTQEEINSKLDLINYNNVQLDDNNKTVFLKNPGMMIDLGGIAKGHTADEISKILKDNKVNSAIIDLGGNIYTHGKKLSGENWKIGIQDPFSDRGEIIGTLSITSKSIVTSGIYERYIEENGVKYHHILNPSTGYPYDNELAGVTIISDKSMDGDALSTAVFAMGLNNGIDFVESQKNIEAILVTKENKVYITSGLKDTFTITNENFTLAN